MDAAAQQRTVAGAQIADRAAAAEGLNNTEIAARLGVHRNVAGKWRRRFGSTASMV